jgi:hypothetical protein
MARDPSILQKYPDNPFNPGYGTAPPLLAGREETINDRLLGLNRGPGRHEFHHVIVGARGTGKTVLLGEIGRAAEEHNRALLLHWSGSEPLGARLADQAPLLESALHGFARRGARAFRGEVVVKAAPAGVGAEARVGTRDRAGAPGGFHLLEQLGRIAAERQRTILLLADELQAADIADLRQLGVSAQHLTMTLRLPVAVLGAGLPHTMRLLRTSGVTFLERQLVTTIGALDPASTRDAIEIPFVDAGRSVAADALEHLASASGGYPFAVQVVGYHAWEVAGDDDRVTVAHAKGASRLAIRHLERTVFEGSWERIGRADRAVLYLAATLADRSDTLTMASLADAIGRPMRSLSAARDRLINEHQVLHAEQRGSVRFTVPGFRDWVVARGTALLALGDGADAGNEQFRTIERSVGADPEP